MRVRFYSSATVDAAFYPVRLSGLDEMNLKAAQNHYIQNMNLANVLSVK